MLFFSIGMWSGHQCRELWLQQQPLLYTHRRHTETRYETDVMLTLTDTLHTHTHTIYSCVCMWKLTHTHTHITAVCMWKIKETETQHHGPHAVKPETIRWKHHTGPHLCWNTQHIDRPYTLSHTHTSNVTLWPKRVTTAHNAHNNTQQQHRTSFTVFLKRF